jgi:hypothetical protein
MRPGNPMRLDFSGHERESVRTNSEIGWNDQQKFRTSESNKISANPLVAHLRQAG